MALKNTSWLTWAVAGVMAFAVGSCILQQDKSREAAEIAKTTAATLEAAKTPEQRASEAAEKKRLENDFQFGVAATRAVKASMKDPNSFEFVQAGVIPDGALCLIYRGRNSFNAVVTEQVAIRRDRKRGDWNKECARSNIPNFSHIGKAL